MLLEVQRISSSGGKRGFRFFLALFNAFFAFLSRLALAFRGLLLDPLCSGEGFGSERKNAWLEQNLFEALDVCAGRALVVGVCSEAAMG